MLTTLLLVILGFVAGLLGALTGIGGGSAHTDSSPSFWHPNPSSHRYQPGRGHHHLGGQFFGSPAEAHNGYPSGYDA